MTEKDAYEQAYNNGYNAGRKAVLIEQLEKVKRDGTTFQNLTVLLWLTGFIIKCAENNND